MSMKVVGQNSG